MSGANSSSHRSRFGSRALIEFTFQEAIFIEYPSFKGGVARLTCASRGSPARCFDRKRAKDKSGEAPCPLPKSSKAYIMRAFITALAGPVGEDMNSSVIDAPELTLSESAAKRIAFLVAQEEEPGVMLRVTVSGGGCSGFRYDFSFDSSINEDDRVFERDGAKVVLDEDSLDILSGSLVNFVDDLMGAYFTIENPNASSSCG